MGFLDFDAADREDRDDDRQAIDDLHRELSHGPHDPAAFGMMADAFRNKGHHALGDAIGILAHGHPSPFQPHDNGRQLTVADHPRLGLHQGVGDWDRPGYGRTRHFRAEGIPFMISRQDHSHILSMGNPSGMYAIGQVRLPLDHGDAITKKHVSPMDIPLRERVGPDVGELTAEANDHRLERLSRSDSLGGLLDATEGFYDLPTTPYGDRASWASATGQPWDYSVAMMRMAMCDPGEPGTCTGSNKREPVRLSMTNVDEIIARALYDVVRSAGGGLSLGMIRNWIQGLR